MSDNYPGKSAWVFSMSTAFFNEIHRKGVYKNLFSQNFLNNCHRLMQNISLLQIYTVKNHLMANISTTIWNWITKHKKQVRSYKHIRTNSHVFTINFEQVTIQLLERLWK